MHEQIDSFRSALNRAPISRFQWKLLILLTLLLVTDGYDALSLGYLVPSLAQDWHVEKAAFGSVFSANLLGLMLGSLWITPIADRFGIRRVLIICVLLYSFLTLLMVYANSIPVLMGARLLCGIGMGGAMPCAMALMSEYSPPRKRTLMVTLAACGFSLGGAAGGFVAAILIERFGWQAVFAAGGIAPLCLIPAMLIFLPESLPRLLKDDVPYVRLRQVVARMKLNWEPVLSPQSNEVTSVQSERLAVGELFRYGFARPTLLLWATFVMAMLLLYFMVSWLPTLLKDSGFDLQHANLLTSLFLFAGTLGAGVMAYYADRVENKVRLLCCVLAGAGVFTGLLGMFHDQTWVVILLVFAAGLCIIGGQLTLNAFCSNFYPPHCRATGTGWALGIGRFGSIVAPLIGALLIQHQVPVGQIFLFCSVPAFMAAVFVSRVRAPNGGDNAPHTAAPTVMPAQSS
jgi:MFS transporter, AAHS family, 4-hydroxybenzoate transporter